MGQPRPLFVLLKHTFFRKTGGFIGIRTRIVGVEGERADHLTTTTAPMSNLYILFTILSLSLFYIRDPKNRLSKKASPIFFAAV